MPRRSYVKSRSGCARCKRRRVKCDEKVPCGACARHEAHCTLSLLRCPQLPSSSVATIPLAPSWLPEDPGLGLPSPRPSLTPSPGLESLTSDQTRPQDTQHSSQLKFPSSDLFSHLSGSLAGVEPPRLSDSAWLQDLELLHHYHAHNRGSLLGAADIGQINEITIVQLGLGDEGLMHQILAVSAFHKAFLQPSRRRAYSLRGLHHQTEAARTLRGQLLCLTRENVHACFATAVLLTIGSFAALHRTGDAAGEENAAGCDPTVDDMMRVFFFTRGTFAIMESEGEFLKAGPLGELFTVRTYGRQAPGLMEICERLRDLAICVQGRQHAMAKAGVEAARIVQAEIIRLTEHIHQAIQLAPRSPEWRAALSWPMRFDDTFMALVAQKDHLALALVAFHCVAMHRAEQLAWWTTGWAPCVLADIQRYLAGSPYESLIQWPLRVVWA